MKNISPFIFLIIFFMACSNEAFISVSTSIVLLIGCFTIIVPH